jgi:hypothetical protein
MSFIKTTVEDVKLIQFYYPLNNIWEKASEITAFKASGVRKSDGQADFDRVHISKDERDHLKEYIYEAILEVFGIMFKVLGEQPIFHDEDVTTDPGDPDATPAVAPTLEKCSGAYLDDNETGYREANLSLIDSKIKRSLIDFVLREWYWLKNLPEDSAMHQARFNKTIVEIQDLTLSLRKPK